VVLWRPLQHGKHLRTDAIFLFRTFDGIDDCRVEGCAHLLAEDDA